MRAFELYLNPKKKEDLFLNSLVYEPANIYEKRLGSLYMIAELERALPKNAHFLNNLFSVIKKEYYSSGLKKSCELSLQGALKMGNDFLSKESRRGNVDWLGNLNFAVLSYKEPVLNFSKVGDMKIFLMRNGELIDINQSLESELPHPDPLKVFGSMAAGKLAEKDKVIALNKNILSFFGKKQNFLNELSLVSDEKDLKQILKKYRETLSETAGICLLLSVGAGQDSKSKVTMKENLPTFSFSKIFFRPLKRFFSETFKKPKIKIKIKKPSFALKKPKIVFKKPRIPEFHLPRFKFKVSFNRKKILLIFSLILMLFLFFQLFGGEKEKELQALQEKIAEAQNKVLMAENFLILRDEDKASQLFLEALEVLSPLTERGCPLKEEALSLQSSIENELLKLSGY